MEIRSSQVPVELPLQIDRFFQVWSYQVSHQMLVLRSSALGGQTATVDITFLNVVGMKLKSGYRGLAIDQVTDALELAEVASIVDVPDEFDSRYLKLRLSGEGKSGYVVCQAIRVEQH